ncbi:MAG: S-adenosylmethionine:tRNA ribosyltransferase-isomerase, partial [Armatimonadetes bacterium]|nr:S-adenosylmethionine:tRNA ribosyltransferase-isomerase [Anaerolineae bacterium]
MLLTDYDYDLPAHYIAQTPADPRDASKLMVLQRTAGILEHRRFRAIADYLRAGDVLVLNSTRVLPARLPAIKATGGAAEVLLLRMLTPDRWRALVGGRGLVTGVVLSFPHSDLTATVVAELDGAERELHFSQPLSDALLQQLGEMPLPPYIHTRLEDSERYQTVYNREVGAAAAPTAGLHFTPELLLELRELGVQLAYCVLHIGLDTFAPVKAEDITQHKIHSERALLTTENANVINQAKLA